MDATKTHCGENYSGKTQWRKAKVIQAGGCNIADMMNATKPGPDTSLAFAPFLISHHYRRTFPKSDMNEVRVEA